MRFFEWWAGLPWWLRVGIAVPFLLSSTIFFFVFDRIWPWGWAIGIALLIFSFPSKAGKKGYHDF